jgi:muramoyltetrapeptide carboxypeptidase
VLGTGRPGRPLLRPEPLGPGARVAVVAPAGPVPAARLEAGLAVLRSWGLEVQVGDHVRGADHPYLAASDDARARDLMTAWLDGGVAAVVCARGGYGAQRIVDLLDWDRLARSRPKLLVGFSDVTALLQAFAARLGLMTVHGPVVTSLGAGDDESREHLRRTLFEPAAERVLTPDPLDVLVPGRAEGVLVGGNVAVLASGAGTPRVMPAAGSIAVLEDVREEPYKLDRLLTQLRRSGWLDGVRGVVVGQLTDCGPEETVRALLVDRLGGLGVPVVAGAPFGHENRNLALPLGVPAALDATPGLAGALRLA